MFTFINQDKYVAFLYRIENIDTTRSDLRCRPGYTLHTPVGTEGQTGYNKTKEQFVKPRRRELPELSYSQLQFSPSLIRINKAYPDWLAAQKTPHKKKAPV